jgi:pimeloyl-ACP methyl ester carboxylesterase
MGDGCRSLRPTPEGRPLLKECLHANDYHQDGIEIFYKDWGSGQPILFSHGWPLSADDWDTQLLFFLHQKLLRAYQESCVKGHSQPGDGLGETHDHTQRAN